MIFKILKELGYVRRMFVISTKKGIYHSWGGDNGEIESWLEFADLRWTILHGDDKERNLDSDADIFLINPAGLKWFFGAHSEGRKKLVLDWSRFKKVGCDMLLVDESTDFKASDSQRFKILRQAVPKFKRRYILTGTPSPNGLMDLFGQIYILDEGNALGSYITHYRNNFFYPSGSGGYTWIPQAGAIDRISAKIAPLVLRMEAKDHLTELPELIFDKRWVELPPEAITVYKQMEDALIAVLESEEFVAANEAVAAGKCRQICAGGLYSTDVFGKRDHVVIHEAKLDALSELLDELMGDPILLFYEFNFEKEMLKKRFPFAKFLDGGKNEPDTISAFNRGELPLVCGQPASASKSINMQKSCGHVGWLTQTWKSDDHKQGIDRVLRQGNSRQYVVSHYFMVKGTIDEIVFARIVQKDKLSADLSTAIKRLRDIAIGV